MKLKNYTILLVAILAIGASPSTALAERKASTSPKASAAPKASAKASASKARTTSADRAKSRSVSSQPASTQQRAEIYFARLDANADRRVTFKEYSERRPGRKQNPSVLQSLFEKLDKNKNGYLTPSEFIEARTSAS